MRLAYGLTLLGAASSLAAHSKVTPRDFNTNDYYVVHLASDAEPAVVARELGLTHVGQLGELDSHHVFSGEKAPHDIVKRGLEKRGLERRSAFGSSALDGVLFSEKQALRSPWPKRVPPPPRAGPSPFRARQEDAPDANAVKKLTQVAKTLNIEDPIFHEQWHLFNSVQLGHDVNVTDVWLSGVTGKNATVSIVDDGLDMYSDDLKGNYYAKGSYDFNDKTEEPKPRLSDDRHGTRCAGEVAAVRNDVCGVGVAFDAKVSGLRILSKLISDADEAVALNYDFHNNHIYSCSWGPPDDGKSMDAPGLLIRRAMLNAVQKGRDGKGSIYVFASGNGAANEDNCNFDGYTNSIYSITVGAIDRKGLHPYYSEACSANLVVTYSSGSGDAIHTTDVGTNQCYNGHGGTSAAAPLAAGIFALVLEVRPDLTWRDMQYLAFMTAVPLNLDSGDWQDTTIGKKYSHTYGYGKVDTFGIVEAAKTWKLVKPQAYFFSPWIHVKHGIPEGDAGLATKFEVTEDMLAKANLERVEHVTVTMNIEHSRRGDLSVDLISPNKVISHLSVTRRLDNAKSGYKDWTFMSVVHWGESGVGTWTIVVRDTKANEFQGNFTDWHLKLWGEARDASKAVLLPMPTENDDKDHDKPSTTTVAAETITMPPGSAPTPDKPITTPSSGHPDRPVNNKPTGAGSPGSQVSQVTTDQGSAVSGSPATQSNSSWLPSFLPTFGVSSHTQVWIYGALGLIVVFCIGLGIYLFMARQRRLRNSPRDNYEFELLDEEEAEGLNRGEKGFTGGQKGRKTRGGELYDAFAGGSDDEDEFATEQYHDRAEGSAERTHDNDDDGHHVIGDDSEDEDEKRPMTSR
ncbi:hypothetical protein MCOR07_010767 [Pyricularia oryzae]|uniref:P/Homo B domain-containing protein n=2 Tax=Pyricularia TaxID=48558 RepID=A0ABQ8N7K9_PYRGI|nr:hypothetical protein MCOR01_005195 [Pyricularia oryzae]KAI6292575.1 hypothetical protein MCOR33_009744 [Pyricularia grisea]KAI6254577.1 hypothetical protein MCOR19_008909 [Pyricularia oryzae]KAI6271289.1 hypothetical protein MCOR26_007883 [Pyricularia oryzae]KAI6310531.1 hypothetical protein MCOR29_008601 [Pyricularia oryzae]